MLRFAPLLLLLAGCAAAPKTYQQACFERTTPAPTVAQSLSGSRETPRFDPVLTVERNARATLVYCN